MWGSIIIHPKPYSIYFKGTTTVKQVGVAKGRRDPHMISIMKTLTIGTLAIINTNNHILTQTITQISDT